MSAFSKGGFSGAHQSPPTVTYFLQGLPRLRRVLQPPTDNVPVLENLSSLILCLVWMMAHAVPTVADVAKDRAIRYHDVVMPCAFSGLDWSSGARYGARIRCSRVGGCGAVPALRPRPRQDHVQGGVEVRRPVQRTDLLQASAEAGAAVCG